MTVNDNIKKKIDEIISVKHFHVTYSQENIIFSPEQAQRNLDILTKRMENNK